MKRQRRSAQISRLIRKLRGHNLVVQSPRCRVYRVTDYGSQIMSAALYCQTTLFPEGVHIITLQHSRRAA